MLNRRFINAFTAVVLAGMVTLNFFVPVVWQLYLLIVLLWLLTTICGSFFIRWDYHLKSLHAIRNSDRLEVAITFDDGPDPEFTPKVLALLKQHGAKATFFCIGQQLLKHPHILAEIIADGHSVGNHTYTHTKLFGFLGLSSVLDELQKTNAIVKATTGLDMKLYRPCFGVTNPKIEKAVQILKLRSIGWRVRSLDTTPRGQSRVLNRITSKLVKGDIVLLHDTSGKTVAVLEQLLLFLRENNLKSVTVDQLLNIEAYA